MRLNPFVVSFENHAQFQTTIGKLHTRSQSKAGQKPDPLMTHKDVPVCKQRFLSGIAFQ